MLTPGTLAGDPARLLTTFLGLISASILPSISLLAGAMTAGSRSVHALDRLHAELQAATTALLTLLGCVGLVFAALFTMSIPPAHLLTRVPHLTTDILPRAGQGIAVAASSIILLRVGQIPAILKRSLSIRHEIATEEARRKTMENASKVGEAKAIFGRDPTFGKTVKLADLQRDGGV